MLEEIRTRQILREKADRKQSTKYPNTVTKIGKY